MFNAHWRISVHPGRGRPEEVVNVFLFTNYNIVLDYKPLLYKGASPKRGIPPYFCGKKGHT